MKHLHLWKPLACASALLIASGTAVAADNPFDVRLKIRTGVQIKSTAEDKLTARTLGMGVEGGFQTSVGRFGLELGWVYKPGDQYLFDVTTQPIADGKVLIPGKYVDQRRNEINGFAVRLSYQKEFTTWGFNAGLQIGSRVRQDYYGDVQTGTTTTTATARDTYYGVAQLTKTSVSPYLGLTYRMSEFSSLEINAVVLRYTMPTYTHQAGYATGTNNDVSRDYVKETSRTIPHLEVGYVFRF